MFLVFTQEATRFKLLNKEKIDNTMTSSINYPLLLNYSKNYSIIFRHNYRKNGLERA
jgi:hypothetical protein